MSGKASIQKEIEYYTKLISLHKQSQGKKYAHGKQFATNSMNRKLHRRNQSTKYTWNEDKSNKRIIHARPASYNYSTSRLTDDQCKQRTKINGCTGQPHPVLVRTTPQIATSSSVNNATASLGLFQTAKSNKYKWKNSESSAKSNHNADMSALNSLSSSFPAKTTKIMNGVTITPVKRKLVEKQTPGSSKRVKPNLMLNHVPSSITSTSQANRFHWCKSEKIESSSPSLCNKQIFAVSSKPLYLNQSKMYNWNQQSKNSFEKYSDLTRANQFMSIGKNSRLNAINVGKQNLQKYKTFHAVYRKHQQPDINVSKDPYKVIKKHAVPFTQGGKVPYTHTTSIFQHNARGTRPFSMKQSRGFVITRNHYKLVRVGRQSRSHRTGNIVLERKLSRAKRPVLKYVQHFSSIKQRLASHVLHKSLDTIRSRNKRTKKKVYCIFYNRFGKCNRGGKCQYTHDPERVAVCTRFLRGTCRKHSCQFSHKLSKKKMPVCSFFLKGKCSTKDCPYLHVFLGHGAPVCKDFATTGFCSKAENCRQQHIKVCYEFHKKGSCPRGDKCNLPHKQKSSKRKKKQPNADGISPMQTRLNPRISERRNKSLPSTGIGFIPLPNPPSDIIREDAACSVFPTDSSIPDMKEAEVMRIQPRLNLRSRVPK